MLDQNGDSDSRTFRLLRQSPVEYTPHRVVSLVPGLTESLFDLNLGERLIAVTKSCVRPTGKVDSLLKVGDPKDPDLEQIIRLQPDLVLLDDEENRQEDAEALRLAGLSIWITGPHTVYDTLNLLWDIMTVFDHAVMIPRVREIERAYDYSSAAALTSEPVRVFAPLARDPWTTFDTGTYAHDVLRVCGGKNITAVREQQTSDGELRMAGRAHPITIEEIVAAQPEIVLLPEKTFSQADIDDLKLLDIPAAHADRIYLIDGTLLTWRGTRVAYALRDLPPLLGGGLC